MSIDTAGLEIHRVPVDTLKQLEGNARLHVDRNREAIRKSLEVFGQVEPLVVRTATGEVIGGNGRLQEMIELGWSDVDVVYLDVDEQTAVALSIALNKTGDTSEFDFQRLSEMLQSLQADGFDLTATGFADFELDPLLKSEWEPPKVDDPVDGTDDPAGKTHKTVGFSEDEWGVIDAALQKLASDGQARSAAEGIVAVCEEYVS